MRKIHTDQDVGLLSALPYATMFGNSMIWASYGLTADHVPLIVTHAGGVAIASVYLLTYHRFSVDSVALRQVFASTACVASVALLTTSGWAYGALPADVAILALGWLGVGSFIAQMSGTLSTVRIVIRDKDPSSLPLALIIAGAVTSGAWLSYGYCVAGDAFVWMPAGVGLMICMGQLALFARYGIRS
jgi:hypothetical protein